MLQPADCPSLSSSDLEQVERRLVAAIDARDKALPSHGNRGHTVPAIPDTAESQAAGQRVRETVDGAIAAGRWTGEDAAALRDLMPVAPVAAHEALTALAMAVNAQMVEVEPHALPF